MLNMPKGLVAKLQGKQQLCIYLLYESLIGQCEYRAQPKGSFWWRYFIDTKDAVLLLIFTNEFVFIVLYLKFSFRASRMKPRGLWYG